MSFLSKYCLGARNTSNFFHAVFFKKSKSVTGNCRNPLNFLIFPRVYSCAFKFRDINKQNHETMVFRTVLLLIKTCNFTFSFKFIKICFPITQFALWHALNVPWHIFVSRKFTENYKRMKKRSCNHAQRSYVSYCYCHRFAVMALFAIRKLCILFLTFVVRRFSRYYSTE